MGVSSKILALLVAVLMIAASMSAFAAEEPTTGTITIKNSEKDTEYDFYKILDLELHDLDNVTTTYESYTYSLNSKWHDFFTTGAGKDYLLDTNSGSLNSINVDGTIKYINLDNNNIVAFTNSAMQYALTNNIAYDAKATGTGSDLAVTAATLGYYLMIPVDASIKTAQSSGSVASLTSTVPNVDILVKAIKPSITKEDDVEDAEIGQTVNYTLTGTVPNTAGYPSYTYKIKDTMTSGLTFKKDVQVSVADYSSTDTPVAQLEGYSIDYTTDTNGFTVTIPVTLLQNYIGKTITLTYTAVVNDDAVVHSQEKNHAEIIYGHDPNHLEHGTPVEEEVYSSKITVNKYYGDSASAADKKLPGAKFALMDSTGKFYKYTAATDTTDATVTWVTVTNGPAANNTSVITDTMVTAISSADITKVITEDDGSAEFKGLKNGTYYLVEYEAPEGYTRVDKAFQVVIAGSDVDVGEKANLENKAQAGQTEFDANDNKTVDVQNQSGTTLPSTGGIGTTIFYVAGGILVLAAVILLVTKRRMGAND